MPTENYEIDKYLSEHSGIEYEEESYYQEEPVESRPYNEIRKEITLNKEQYALNYVFEMIQTNYLDLSPEFQRNEVWNDEVKKSLFIESLLLNIPVPIFYVYNNEDGQLFVIDGKQRLSTIRDFLLNEFPLKNVKYLRDYNGLTFKNLPERVQLDLKRYQCSFYVLNYNTPKYYLFDIFMRLNTGGMPLTSQEIRNIFAKPKVRTLMKHMAKAKIFCMSTRNKINDSRMDAQELVLRFIALKKKYDFKIGRLNFNETSLSKLLEHTIAELNNEDQNEYDKYISSFEAGCQNALNLFGDYAFSRVTIKSNKLTKCSNVINRSLFAVFTVLLSEEIYNQMDLSEYKISVLMDLGLYLDHAGSSLLAGTSNKNNIINLFGAIQGILKDNIHVK